jgi:hypothetical protein
MAVRQWRLEKPGPHTVVLEHGWLGRCRLSVDGTLIEERSKKIWDTGWEHRFEIEGLPCIARVIYRGLHYDYELWVDGKLV